MPILSSAKKALRVSLRKTVINHRVKSKAKTAMDMMKKKPTADNLKAAFSAVDKAAKGKVFHHNKAARLKSQLSKLLPSK